jgi:hypothetical protein
LPQEQHNATSPKRKPLCSMSELMKYFFYTLICGVLLLGFIFFTKRIIRIKQSEKPYRKLNFKHDLPLFYELVVIWGTENQVIGSLGEKLNFDNKKDLLQSINKLINQESIGKLRFSITLTICQNDAKINTYIYRENNNLFIGNKSLSIFNKAINEKEFSERIDELINRT